jgi:hypothetical protein
LTFYIEIFVIFFHKMVSPTGFEPVTHSLKGNCSTD